MWRGWCRLPLRPPLQKLRWVRSVGQRAVLCCVVLTGVAEVFMKEAHTDQDMDDIAHSVPAKMLKTMQRDDDEHDTKAAAAGDDADASGAESKDKDKATDKSNGTAADAMELDEGPTPLVQRAAAAAAIGAVGAKAKVRRVLLAVEWRVSHFFVLRLAGACACRGAGVEAACVHGGGEATATH